MKRVYRMHWPLSFEWNNGTDIWNNYLCLNNWNADSLLDFAASFCLSYFLGCLNDFLAWMHLHSRVLILSFISSSSKNEMSWMHYQLSVVYWFGSTLRQSPLNLNQIGPLFAFSWNFKHNFNFQLQTIFIFKYFSALFQAHSYSFANSLQFFNSFTVLENWNLYNFVIDPIHSCIVNCKWARIIVLVQPKCGCLQNNAHIWLLSNPAFWTHRWAFAIQEVCLLFRERERQRMNKKQTNSARGDVPWMD